MGIRTVFVSIVLLLPALARGAQEAPAWGTSVSEDYDIWGWVSAYGRQDEESWADLGQAERAALVKKARSACETAVREMNAAQGQTDGDAMLAIPRASVDRMKACSAGGEGAADRLADKCRRLAAIKQKAAAGKFDQADSDWLNANGLTLRMDQSQAEKLAGDKAKAAENNKKASAAVQKKYGAMGKKDLDAGSLSKAYDGGGGKDAQGAEAVALSGKHKAAPPSPGDRAPKKKLSFTPPPDMELTEEFKGMKGYGEMKKENTYHKVMNEVDKDGIDAAAKNQKIKAAGYATLKSVYAVSKDFDETFVNNPSPKNEDVSKVIERIKSKAKNPQEAWEIAYQMRTKRDFPALRDAEHYLWACSEASESKWKATRTLITTPLYSAAKLPGLRNIFFDENTSPPSVSEVKWGWKGATDCVR